jgi:hypothetical protein
MPVPPKLERELAELRERYSVEVVEDPEFINLIFKDFPLGGGFNVPTSDLLLRVPKTYPEAGPDMFYTDPLVTLANGQIAKTTEHIELHVSRNWRRFSWHRQQPWNPIIDNMHDHLEFINHRLRQDE